MTLTTRLVSTFALLLVICAVVPISAQDADRSMPAQQPAQVLSAQGELQRVDLDQHRLWVQTADQKQLQFQFNDDTEIVGADQNVEGLATMTGTQVTVRYKAEGETAVATRIEIQKSDASRGGM